MDGWVVTYTPCSINHPHLVLSAFMYPGTSTPAWHLTTYNSGTWWLFVSLLVWPARLAF